MRLLRDYTHWMKFEPGMNCDVMKSLLKEMSQEGFNPHGFMVGLLLDEVKIKSGLQYPLADREICHLADRENKAYS